MPESASNFLLFLCTRCPACAKFIPLMPLVHHYPTSRRVRVHIVAIAIATKSPKVISRARCCVCLASRPQSSVPSSPPPPPSAAPLRTVVDLAIPVSPLAALTAGWTGVWQATQWRPRCLRVAAPFLLFATMLGGRGRRLCWPLIPVPRRVVESFRLVLWWFLV